jgi:hypothetical protein
MKHKKLLAIEVVGIDGRQSLLVAKEWAKVGLNQLQLDTKDLPNGMYFVNLLSDEGKEYSFKFIVQH